MMTPQHPMSTHNQPAAWQRWHQHGADLLAQSISHDLLALAARAAMLKRLQHRHFNTVTRLQPKTLPRITN